MSSEQPITFEQVESEIRSDGRYPFEAFEFLREGLEFTSSSVHGPYRKDQPRHVSGQALCYGLRQHALNKFGALAGVVLGKWNIRCTHDFGEMVFLMIRIGFFGKQETDRIEDFDDVYDFDEAFGEFDVPLDNFDESLDLDCDE